MGLINAQLVVSLKISRISHQRQKQSEGARYSTLCEHCLTFNLLIQRATCTRVGTLLVATIYLQLIQNRYML